VLPMKAGAKPLDCGLAKLKAPGVLAASVATWTLPTQPPMAAGTFPGLALAACYTADHFGGQRRHILPSHFVGNGGAMRLLVLNSVLAALVALTACGGGTAPASPAPTAVGCGDAPQLRQRAIANPAGSVCCAATGCSDITEALRTMTAKIESVLEFMTTSTERCGPAVGARPEPPPPRKSAA
jgi:hypothetical protein